MMKRIPYLGAYAILALVIMLAADGCRPRHKSNGTQAGSSNPARDAAASQPDIPTPADAPSVGEPIEHAADEPAPPLQLAVELEYDEVFVGDFVTVRIGIDSPQADRRFEEEMIARQTTSGPDGRRGATLHADRPAIEPRWAEAVGLTIYRIAADGSRTPVSNDGPAWKRLTAAAEDPMAAAIRQWVIAPTAELTPGAYVVAATLDPQGLTVPGPLSNDKLEAEMAFTVRQPADKREEAIHAERLALAYRTAGKPDEVRKFAQQALAADPESRTPQRVQLMIALGNVCVAQGDFKAALEVYRKLVQLPLPLELMELVKQRLDVLGKVSKADR
jgi:hypothetical protein